ncbi:hypothetical protein [Comamonas kerstersii]|uniref:hypothetical protein n=1 Tax=Comamonas kerstersii TaxID=225992 RepID=UPI00266D070B|nr:hypothetical protein [Comamonas kerstersii]
MRHTLSVLTATCILALSQPAWASAFDRESQQRARTVAMRLSREVRVHAAQTLSQWQTQAASSPRRLLPLNRILCAAQLWLQQEGQALLSSVVHATPIIRAAWLRPSTWAAERFSPALDAAMVERWLQAWLKSRQEV